MSDRYAHMRTSCAHPCILPHMRTSLHYYVHFARPDQIEQKKEVFFFCVFLETWFTVKHSHVRTDTWHGFPGHNLTNLSRMKKHESKRPSSTYLCVHVRKNLFVTFTLLSVSSQVIICTEVKHTVFDLRPPLQNNPLVTVTNTLNKSVYKLPTLFTSFSSFI